MTPALSRRGLLAMLPAIAVGVAAPLRAAVPAAGQRELSAPDGRAIPLWVWRARTPRRGTIAFSHGALSAPWRYPAMIEPWVAAGYDVLAPLHVDSRDHPDAARLVARDTWQCRIEDMRAVSQAIAGPYIAAGHSYGALTALVLGGASARVPEAVQGPLRDPAAHCAVAFSPPPPMPKLISAAGYATLAVPALIETGTRDIPPAAAGDPEGWRGHYLAYDAAPRGGHRYGLVIDGVDHYFGGLICDPAKTGPDQRPQLDAAVTIATLFMAGWGPREDGPARRQLDARLAAGGAVRLAAR